MIRYYQIFIVFDDSGNVVTSHETFNEALEHAKEINGSIRAETMQDWDYYPFASTTN